MILYHAITTYQLINCIEHRLIYHREDEAAIIIPSFLKKKIPHYEELLYFFRVILMFNYTKYNGKSKEYILEYLFEDFDELLEQTIEKYEKVYVGGAQYYFSIYLSEKMKKFSIFEEGAGLLSRHELLVETARKQGVLNIDLINEYEMYELTNSFIEKKYCLLSAQKEDFFDEQAVDFDVVKLFSLLDEKEQNKIKEFFRCPSKIEGDEEAVLLLTQHFANLNQMSFERQVMVYQILLDYFLEGKQIILKPHPDDIMYYEKLFPDVRIIKEKFPSELLPFVFENTPKNISTISSTGINLIQNEFENVIKFDVEYESCFERTHLYYFALKLCEYLKIKTLGIIGCHEILVKNLLNVVSVPGRMNITDEDNAQVLLIDDLSDEHQNLTEIIEKCEFAIFFNSKKEYRFMEEFSLLELIPVCLRKTKVKDDENYHNMDEERFYAYVKDNERRKNVKKFSEQKKLYACGIEINVEEMTDKDLYIKVLEGQIDALERRLLFYIEKDKGEN